MEEKNSSARIQKRIKIPHIASVSVILTALFFSICSQPSSASAAAAYTMSNNYFNVQIGQYGDINSLKLVNDAFPTNYVMNATSAPNQNTSDHEWTGELMFQSRLADSSGSFAGAYTPALTSQSGDVRVISQDGTGVSVSYANSGNAQGIKNFSVTEKYSLVKDAFVWSITVKNTSNTKLEIGDFGLPLPFNEYWTVPSGTEIYETQVMHHSYVSSNGSYIYAQRPSGIGSMLLMTPDQSTGAGFEYMDHWRVQEHPGTTWSQDQGGWANGLNVYYIHSNGIKSTNRGYLQNSSLYLDPGQSKTYAFQFYNCTNQSMMQSKLYAAGNIDVVSIPGMVFSTDMTAKVDLHTTQSIDYYDLPLGATMVPDPKTPTVLDPKDGSTHHIYDITLSMLGQNNITVHFGGNKTTTLQFYAIEPVGAVLERHATFMTNNQVINAPGQYYDKLIDDWCMDAQKTRIAYQGAGNNAAGWGDDWGWTHAEFLAEKEVYLPVAAEATAVDNYLETAIWNGVMANNHTDYRVNDWYIKPGSSGSNYTRAFAYPHIWNTYFSMYKTEKLHPKTITYIHDANTYLLRAYNIFVVGEGLAMSTGLMGEQTDIELVEALRSEGLISQADNALSILQKKYANFMKSKYPFGSEYNFDNTGEEAVFELARMQSNVPFMELINSKTRACRGTQPLWYYYADPTTICGEAWWNFQYSTALIDPAMNHWILDGHSTTPEVDERMNYAAKIANLVLINSGQIDSNAANIGASAWTYQSEKGNLYQTGGYEPGNAKLHNGFREMTGESDLGLFGEMKVLSSDVATDPIFGLYGYGCDVTDDGTSYTITPKDGIRERINLISKGMTMTLGQDQCVTATIDYKNKNHISFSLNNVDLTAHNTTVTFTGLAAGFYDVTVNGVRTSSFIQPAGKAGVAKVVLNNGAASNVEISLGTEPENITPVVSAGVDNTVTLPSVVTLAGTATDDGIGKPDGTLDVTWSVVSKPASANVIFANANAAGTTATVDKEGTYVFKLSATDGELENSATVTVTVNPMPPVPAVLSEYKFDETSGLTASDSSGSGNNATLYSSGATFTAPTGSAFTGSSYVPANNGKVLKLNGSAGYATLPVNITNNVNDFTIAAWVNVATNNSYARLFDFGSGTSQYMFFAPTNGNGSIFAITTSGNGAEQQLTGPILTTGTWHHVAIVHQGSTGYLYIDGVLQATNDSMTLSPASLGATPNNWIGKSQWGDPLLNGQVDNFKFCSTALTPSQVQTLAGLKPATAIDHIIAPDAIATGVGIAPALPSTVNAVYDNGSTLPVQVTWNAVDPYSYAAAGSFTVNGIINEAFSTSITVNVFTITGYTPPAAVTTYVGTAPVLPTSIKATLSNGATVNAPVTWDAIDPSQYGTYGNSFTVSGTVNGTGYAAKATVNVDRTIVSLSNPSDVVTPAGASPSALFPKTVQATFNDNSTGSISVTWGAAGAYGIQNSTPVTVTGTVANTTLKPSIRYTVGPAVPIAMNDVYVQTIVNAAPVLGTTFDATCTDGSIAAAHVIWPTLNPASYGNVGTYNIIGVVEGSSLTITAHITVTAVDATLSSIPDVNVATAESTAPVFPGTVTVNFTDGSLMQMPVIWPVQAPTRYSSPGIFDVVGTINGYLYGFTQPLTITAHVTVMAASLVSVAPIYVSTTLGKAPVMPATVSGTYSNGTLKPTAVAWNLDPSKYSLSAYTVTGTIAGSTIIATANVGVPVAGMALWYKMNENGGTTLYDSSFNGVNGTLNNSVTWTTGVNSANDAADKGITLSNAYITVPNSTGLSSSNFTFSTWLKRTGSVGTEAVLFWGKPSGNYSSSTGYFITFNSDLIVMLGGTTSFAATNTEPDTLLPNTNTWYNIVVTWDNVTKVGSVYRNGVLFYTTKVAAGNVAAYNGNRWIDFNSPGYGGSYMNNMNEDDVRIYTSALSQSAVTALYNSAIVRYVTVTYDRNNTDTNSTEASPAITTTVYNTSVGTLPSNPARTGYTFVGWYSDTACTTGNEFGATTLVTTNITVYAKWTINQYVVTYDRNNTDINSTDANPAISMVAYNTSVGTLPSKPTRIGYTFGGWYTDQACTAGNEFTETTPVTANVTAYAKWIKNVEPVPNISLDTKVLMSSETEEYGKMYFLSTVMMQEGYTLEQCGVVMAMDNSSGLDVDHYLSKLEAPKQSTNGQFYSVFNVTYEHTIYVRSYLVFTGPQGTETVYSPIDTVKMAK